MEREIGALRLSVRDAHGEPPGSSPVQFTVDGLPVTGNAGEPLLAALLVGGVRFTRTMPKTGEARGGYCLVGRCTDCLVILDGRPNIRACLVALRAGMRVETQQGIGTATEGGDWFDGVGNGSEPPA